MPLRILSSLFCFPEIGSRWRAVIVPVLAVVASLAVRELLETVGQFFYLPFVPAVMVTAMLTGRRSTAFSVALSIAANSTLVAREGVVDMATNALLFVGVSWFIAEMCWRLRAMQERAENLSGRLIHRNEMLDVILASVPLVTVDREGRILTLTRQASAVLGTSGDLAPGSPLSDFVDGFDMATAEDQEDIVWRGRHPDGRTYPLRIKLGVIAQNPDGIHATLCLTDLTQSYTADARARELHTQLNRVWRLNSLGEMAASLAHELNQPLSAATTYLHASQTEVQKAGLMGQSASRTIDLAKAQLLRAGGIIRRMRELLAHESRSLGTERVAPMMADMQGVLAMIQRDRRVTIEIDIDDVNDRVQAERIQFQQAMINLIRNAVEAVDGRANGRVRVTGRPRTDALFELTVEDNGKGVAAEQLDTIFRPLMTTKSAGMGLGLSVTRTIVESHGGTLSVGGSELGGAAFSFSLLREQELEDA
ncbi:ATP-binding protein [Roseibacterium beibuensis]|uniref:ATP-binding protein n=1 Tax=[Roseibacterium] beibuensis TaxID=1193142 RepID=UPI00217E8E20|nr:ATP-binding protein [Roseibacterium beibuensis]MCS6627099.1 ATP-binding protein [Roseibacterium beibuensis]